MTIFDQRNQKVKYQFNAAGNINFGTVQNTASLLIELRKLRSEFDNAIATGIFKKKIALEVNYKLDKVLVAAEEPKPDKKTFEEHLNEVIALIEGVVAATGLVAALTQAADMVRKLL